MSDIVQEDSPQNDPEAPPQEAQKKIVEVSDTMDTSDINTNNEGDTNKCSGSISEEKMDVDEGEVSEKESQIECNLSSDAQKEVKQVESAANTIEKMDTHTSPENTNNDVNEDKNNEEVGIDETDQITLTENIDPQSQIAKNSENTNKGDDETNKDDTMDTTTLNTAKNKNNEDTDTTCPEKDVQSGIDKDCENADKGSDETNKDDTVDTTTLNTAVNKYNEDADTTCAEKDIQSEIDKDSKNTDKGDDETNKDDTVDTTTLNIDINKDNEDTDTTCSEKGIQSEIDKDSENTDKGDDETNKDVTMDTTTLNTARNKDNEGTDTTCPEKDTQSEIDKDSENTDRGDDETNKDDTMDTTTPSAAINKDNEDTDRTCPEKDIQSEIDKDSEHRDKGNDETNKDDTMDTTTINTAINKDNKDTDTTCPEKDIQSEIDEDRENTDKGDDTTTLNTAINKDNKDTDKNCPEKDISNEEDVLESVTIEGVDEISTQDDNADINKTNEGSDKNKESVQPADKEHAQNNDTSPLVNEQDEGKESSADTAINDENSIFVQMNNERDDSEKSTSNSEQVSTDVDPIGSTEWSQTNDSSFISDFDEADECIIPDTNREEAISAECSNEETLISTPLPATPSTDTDTMKLSEKYLVSVSNSEEESTCMMCNKQRVSKYNCIKDTEKTAICCEDCLAKLKEKYADQVIVRQLRVKNFSIDKDLQNSPETSTFGVSKAPIAYKITCKSCGTRITDMKNNLSWEALDFCDEQCLTEHQKLYGSYCAHCRIEVKENFLGKYCVRFGYSVRQFCSSTCLEQYKKKSKVCSFCQDDISGNLSGFLTSIGDRGLSKDFCSAQCMQRHSEINKYLKGIRATDECCVCHKRGPIEIEFEHKSKNNLFCGEPCFVAFKYVNDVNPEKCNMCCRYYVNQTLTSSYVIRYDGVFKKFCHKTCQNIYITTNRKIVSCCWCKVKKYNFDMIQKYQADRYVLIVCSLACLSFFNASITASKIKKKRCDYCHKSCKRQYHITLADDSLRNFCSYACVQEFQSKYISAPARFSEQVALSANTNTRAVARKTNGSLQQRKQIIPDVPGPLPIITSVRSLALVGSPTVNTRSLRSKSSVPIATITTLQTEPPPVRRVILLRPPDIASQRNVATLVKPIMIDIEVEFKPEMIDKATQTEDLKDSLVLVPIPVPVYLPSPMEAFNLLHPMPIPFPLPIPIPMFIPVTKQTANVVLKETKKNQVTDPYEADLLMMAELVAGEVEKKEILESEAEPESDGDNPPDTFSPEPQDASTAFGDDMLQMALKMASDFEEPAVDLEGALTANTITATAASSDHVDEITTIQPSVGRSTFRGRRRRRPTRHGARGRRRGRPPTQPEIAVPIEPEPLPPPEPVEKPDANMCLKYTFGVNAWKQWVTTKNADLEKSSSNSKPFKSDLLQLTSDELNYSLCLFVKEVRKPNGAEYAPDTIYYLCLGIQQYLFENGRIDNIFCDSYYESFTECLDEVCKKFSTLYNDSQYIVTRVEEEHLWESKQLGAHSPHVLLSTLMFFNTKHFNLTNVEEHMQLSFSHIMKHWKRVPNQSGTPQSSTSRNILLRFYPPQSTVESNNRKKKVYEQKKNEENPLRCPVKLYEFYLLKCPESVKTRNDVFYLLPERSCVPDSPVWYSTMALGRDALEKMLHRVKMVKEINVALLAS